MQPTSVMFTACTSPAVHISHPPFLIFPPSSSITSLLSPFHCFFFSTSYKQCSTSSLVSRLPFPDSPYTENETDALATQSVYNYNRSVTLLTHTPYMTSNVFSTVIYLRIEVAYIVILKAIML